VWRATLGVSLVVQLLALYLPRVPSGPQVPGFDKVVHVLIFSAPALAALMARINVPWALGILAVHAPVSELIQHFALSQRSGDVMDVAADLGGVALGGLAFVVLSRRQH
jgi:hypothetical protein